MNPIKCYLSFYKKWYLHFIIWIAPIIEIALGILLKKIFPPSTIFFAPLLFCTFEIMVDYFGMGGLCSKEFGGLDYIKSSARGVQYLRRVLVVETVRKIIFYSAIIYAFNYDKMSENAIGTWICSLAVGIFGCLAVRYISSFSYVVLVSFVGESAFTGIVYAGFNLPPVLMIVVGGVLAVAAIVALHVVCMRKVRLSYYDTKF